MVADASTKKRSIAAASTAGTATMDTSAKRKKSPLADQPQNYYAPSKPMTKEELSAWRKEQRRERNRQSAAASRDKTRVRIEELEGEVARWRHMYDDLRRKMANMERHIEFLSKFHPGAGGVAPGQPGASVFPLPPPQLQQMVTPPGSLPASPRTSPVGYAPYPQMIPTQGQNKTQPPLLPVVPALVPPHVKSLSTSSAPPSHSSVTNPFPPLLSEPKRLVALAVNGNTAETSRHNGVAIEEPKQHLIPISRQA
mmetsp:Transcript_763/g.1638  ORF Transcript_763/g.1638 Transcript_763/m.1638 type:complete len:254 (-) Transcript_763:744-1505(-)